MCNIPVGETPVSTRDLPNVIKRRSGKKPSQHTVWRWIRTGLSGVKLERYYIAGDAYTTQEALDRFDAAVTQKRNREIGSEAHNATQRRALKKVRKHLKVTS